MRSIYHAGVSEPRLPFGEKRRPVFDVVMGAVGPVACLLLDPFVFKTGDLFGPAAWFERFRGAAYLFFGLEILALVLWLVRPTSRPAVAGLFGGVLLTGGMAALALGVLLLPLSLVGLLVGIGVLGLVPFFTALAFFRNAARALRAAGVAVPVPVLAAVVAGALGPPGAAAAGHVLGRRATDRAVRLLQEGGAESVERATATMARCRWFVQSDDLVDAYLESRDEAVRDRLASAYARFTGTGIEERIGALRNPD